VGHNGIDSEGTVYWLVYKTCDADEAGISKLRIESLGWNGDGWSSAPSQAFATASK